VADADVEVRWPNRVLVTVTEREPVAWARTAGGWSRRALDGVALPSASEPDDDMARIDLPDLSEDLATSSKELLGALQFVSALPARHHAGTLVTIQDGELWASVAGYQVRLGRPVEMGEKARSLNALLDQDVPEGSLLVLVAPTNPSYMAPTPTERDSTTTDTVGG
jgi:hypothetical protein